MSIGLTVTNSDSRPKWFYWWLLHSRGLDWICKGQWPKAQVAEVSREAGVIPGWKITLLGFDIVFYLQLDFECWPKVITNIRSGCKFKLVSNVQTFAKFDWYQDIVLLWISGFELLSSGYLDIRILSKLPSECLAFYRAWNCGVSYFFQMNNYLSIFHTYLEEEHIFRWLNIFATNIFWKDIVWSSFQQ